MVLEEFANSMALRKGGLSGIQKLIDSKSLGTIELSTGLQVSGVFSNIIAHDGKPVYVQTTGKTALAYREKELVGHGTEYHAEGFGSPIGKLKGINIAIEDMSPRDLSAYAIYEGEQVTLEFEGNIKVTGEIITGTRNIQGKIVLIKFKNCTVSQGDTILFQPEWGIYDMAVGKEVISAYAGPADVNSFDMISHVPSSHTIKQKKSAAREELEQLYQHVRNIRENKTAPLTLEQLFSEVASKHSNDWLLSVEIAEIAHTKNNNKLLEKVLHHLEHLKKIRPEVSLLISNGIELIFPELV
jgi:phenylalanine-4-hydroxylase